jgi:glycosyltransferase involved in cell wall biosynthesis
LICHLTYANVLGYLATRFSRIAMLGVHHSASLPSWGWAGRLILGLSYRGSTIVAVSEAVKSFLKQKLALRNCVVLPNPLHLPKLRLTQSVTTTCVKVVAVGRISEVKNYPFMLEVISQLPSQYHLEIIGPGEYGTLELAAEKLGISQRVIFSGPLSKHDLYSRLAAADVYLMTSQFEGEPSSLLEAAALGLPIVGLRNPGLAEALRKVGGLSSMEQEGPVAVAHNIERASKSSTKPADRGWIFQHDPDNAAHKYCELLGFPYCD